MPNKSGSAYGLTLLCPLKATDTKGQSVKLKLRKKLIALNDLEISPMSKVPNTYLSRFYILEDVFFEDYPHQLEHLNSAYLVFTADLHGELDTYLEGMYNAISTEINSIWEDAYGFDQTKMNANEFKKYIKKCQVETTFYFNGSTDDSLEEQLKALYIKQEFSKFVFENAHKPDIELQDAFKEFIQISKPFEALPSWYAGIEKLEDVVRTK